MEDGISCRTISQHSHRDISQTTINEPLDLTSGYLHDDQHRQAWCRNNEGMDQNLTVLASSRTVMAGYYWPIWWGSQDSKNSQPQTGPSRSQSKTWQGCSRLSFTSSRDLPRRQITDCSPAVTHCSPSLMIDQQSHIVQGSTIMSFDPWRLYCDTKITSHPSSYSM